MSVVLWEPGLTPIIWKEDTISVKPHHCGKNHSAASIYMGIEASS